MFSHPAGVERALCVRCMWMVGKVWVCSGSARLSPAQGCSRPAAASAPPRKRKKAPPKRGFAQFV